MSEPPQDQCFFCGENNPVLLQRHHIVPKEIQPHKDDLPQLDPNDFSRTITVCANHHVGVHWLLRPLVSYLAWTTTEYKPPLPEEIIERVEPIDIKRVLNKLSELEKKNGAVNRDDLFRAVADEEGVTRVKTAQVIGALMSEGTIYSPKPGYFRRSF